MGAWWVKNDDIHLCQQKQKEMSNAITPRYEVKQQIKFGMLFGYVIVDNSKKEELPFEYNENEKWKAESKANLLNTLNVSN